MAGAGLGLELAGLAGHLRTPRTLPAAPRVPGLKPRLSVMEATADSKKVGKVGMRAWDDLSWINFFSRLRGWGRVTLQLSGF